MAIESSTGTPVSALVLTHNEERNIGKCLRSLQWCDDIVVLDSFSDDQTVEIAKSFGARIYQRGFDNYASQRNHALKEIPYQNEWLLMVDADETVPDDLAREISRVTAQADDDISLFYLRFRAYLFGRWIRRSSGYPVWVGRLMRTGAVRIEREVHEQLVCEGRSGRLKGHLDHFSFNNGFSAWFDKHNRYSTMEAQHLYEGRNDTVGLGGLFALDSVRRRRALKSLVYSLPGRPVLMFLGLYIFRGGILEGAAGLTYCLLRSFYEFMINCKLTELKRRSRNLPV